MIVGITMDYVEKQSVLFGDEKTKPYTIVQNNFSYALYSHNLAYTPLFIPPIPNEEFIETILKTVDLVLLSGGEDLHPSMYNHPEKVGLKTTNLYRDEFEFLLVKKAVELKKPILGICRGFQLLNAYFGGTLYQDIPTYYPTFLNHSDLKKDWDEINHEVQILNDSPIFKDYIPTNLAVNSFHHQSVCDLGAPLKVFAVSIDGIVEGFYHQEMPWILGVQWHPEKMLSVDAQYEILEYFKQFKPQ